MKPFATGLLAVITFPFRIPAWIISKKQHVAVTMAIVGVLAAAAAFRAGVNEHELTRLERKLDQGQVLELMMRQDLLDRFAQYPRFHDSYDQHNAEGQRLQREADQLRPGDSDSAAVLDLESQQEFAIARSLQPFLRFSQANLDPDHLELSADEQVLAALRHIGFETYARAGVGPGGTQQSIWRYLKLDIDFHQADVARLM